MDSDHKRTILLIDDDELDVKLFRNVLRIDGFLILEATDALSGIALAREHQPDLILMDLHLPGMGGLNAISRLKENPAVRNIPIVVVASHAMVGDREKAIAAGSTGYITKPINTRTFAETIRTFL